MSCYIFLPFKLREFALGGTFPPKRLGSSRKRLLPSNWWWSHITRNTTSPRETWYFKAAFRLLAARSSATCGSLSDEGGLRSERGSGLPKLFLQRPHTRIFYNRAQLRVLPWGINVWEIFFLCISFIYFCRTWQLMLSLLENCSSSKWNRTETISWLTATNLTILINKYWFQRLRCEYLLVFCLLWW